MRGARLGRAAVGVGALVLVLAEAVTILVPAGAHFPSPHPALGALDEALLKGHMFATRNPDNGEAVIEGRAARGPGARRWRVLRTEDFLVDEVPGARVTRLSAVRARLLGGPEAQREAWAEMARHVLRRQNALHPEAPIDAVRFGLSRWPKDDAGFAAGARPGAVSYVPWFQWEAP